MSTFSALLIILFLGFSSALAQQTQSQDPTSQTASQHDKSGAWLFPVERLNQILPRWLLFGGEYRSRVESADGIIHRGLQRGSAGVIFIDVHLAVSANGAALADDRDVAGGIEEVLFLDEEMKGSLQSRP